MNIARQLQDIPKPKLSDSMKMGIAHNANPHWRECMAELLPMVLELEAEVHRLTESDGYCQYCSDENPNYERAREETNCVTRVTTSVIYFFCNDICADEWEAQQ